MDSDGPREIRNLSIGDVGGHLVQIGVVYGDVSIRDSRVDALTALRSLPADPVPFTGRDVEIERLTRQGGPAVRVIDGMAGVGKTALAVHAAHRLADRYPDGQVFLNLHGHSRDRAAMTAGEALAELLLTLGVAARRIPPGADARGRLWRSLLAEGRFLLVLDDAASSEQVRPLLPGAGTNVVLVTSRRRLGGLQGAASLSLGLLPDVAAADLFARLVSRPGLDGRDGDVGRMVALCGRLPLAVRLAAGRLRHRPAWSPADLIVEMVSARDRLSAIKAEDESLAAAFELSYGDLTGPQQDFFRALGAHFGWDIDAFAAAAAGGITVESARAHLDSLYSWHLIDEPVSGRYQMHDLIREFAQCVSAENPAGGGEAAVRRLVAYYVQGAVKAGDLVSRRTPAVPAPEPAVPSTLPSLTGRRDALRWLGDERRNLYVCVEYAARHGLDAAAMHIPIAIHDYLRSNGPLDQTIYLDCLAVETAARCEDDNALGAALHDLGVMRYLVGDHREAIEALTASLVAFRRRENRLGEAQALNELGIVHRMAGSYAAALEFLRQAIVRYDALGCRLDLTGALNDFGIVLRTVGEYAEARAAHERSLDLYRQAGDLIGQAGSINQLGIVHQMTGDHAQAVAHHEMAFRMYLEAGDLLGQAHASNQLGAACRRAGDRAAAAMALDRSLEQFRRLGNRLGEAHVLYETGALRRQCGDLSAAADTLGRSLGIYRRLSNRLGEARSLDELGCVHMLEGRTETARDHHLHALSLFETLGDRFGQVQARMNLAQIPEEKPCQVYRHYRLALAVARRLGARAEEARVLRRLGIFLLVNGRNGLGARLLEESWKIRGPGRPLPLAIPISADGPEDSGG
ncbi:tetratricopeptide repeat protein [Actinomadura kijaniata]|uniref:tetratricopeptide repeat protein n=1 Tax=Actinomadura kijaniata TaxID=46161 RepID=UPI003F1BE830